MVKVNFVCSVTPGHWTESYVSTLTKMFRQYGIDTKVIELSSYLFDENKEADWNDLEFEQIRDARDCDVWLSMFETEYVLPRIMARARVHRERVILHWHGGDETLAYEDLRSNERHYETVVANWSSFDNVWFNTAANREEFAVRFGSRLSSSRKDFESRTSVIGFPVDGPKGKKFSDRKDQVVVPGRLSHDRHLPMASYFLMPFRSDVIFSAGRLDDDSEEISRVIERMGHKVQLNSREDFGKLLESSKVAFVLGYSDSLNASLVQAAQSGCVCVAPDLPVYQEYLDPRYLYEPFSMDSARVNIELGFELEEYPHQHDVEKYRPKAVIEKMVKSIWECANGCLSRERDGLVV